MMDRRIVITGFMGSGKTSTARALAKMLACELVDLDAVIGQRERRTPAQIIAQDGESAFRQTETRTLRWVLEHHSARLIALGGGAWTVADNRSLINKHRCLTVWLDASFELCWVRIRSGRGKRPLAYNKRRAKALYEQRRPLYELANVRIPVTGLVGGERLAALVDTALKAMQC